MGCDSPLKGYRDADTGKLTFRREGTREKMDVACGQCLGCRLDHSCMWAMRIVHESSMWDADGGNSFVTLTYDNEHVPEDWSLKKKTLLILFGVFGIVLMIGRSDILS